MLIHHCLPARKVLSSSNVSQYMSLVPGAINIKSKDVQPIIEENLSPSLTFLCLNNSMLLYLLKVAVSVFTEQNQTNFLPVFVWHDLITFISCPSLNHYYRQYKAYMSHFPRKVESWMRYWHVLS